MVCGWENMSCSVIKLPACAGALPLTTHANFPLIRDDANRLGTRKHYNYWISMGETIY